MSAAEKDTVYIDIDDEITSIIDKVVSSRHRIIALVLPKRAAVLQSVVNMKLLKRSADDNKKRLVLITSETALLPLAAAAGLHVAKTLQSKPSIPIGGINTDGDTEELTDGDSVTFNKEDTAEPLEAEDDFDPKTAASTSVGDLAGPSVGGAAAANDLETIELDDADDVGPVTLDDKKDDKKDKKAKKDKKDKKLAVPNFDRFRLLIVLGLLGIIVLGVLVYVCAAVLPKASITIVTDTSDVKTNATLTLDTKATDLDTYTGVIPANMQQKQQSSSQQVATTGQQNNGEKAHGSVKIINCAGDNSDAIIPAGTGVSSTSGVTYITQQELDLNSANFDSNGKCKTSGNHTGSVNVVAQKPGTQANLDNGAKFTVAASSNGGYIASSLTASANGSIAGGTDNIVKIVSQTDIDNAQAKITSQDSNTAKDALKTQLDSAGFDAIEATFAAGTPATSPSATVGTPSDTVTVTQVVTYSMYGVKTSDVKDFITSKVKKEIDTSKQSILSDGVSSATYKLTSSSPEQVSISAVSTAGPDIQPDTVKKQAAGQKAGQVTSLLKNDPGVTDVKVKLSPFWVTKVPSKPTKVTVTFQKSSNGN